MPSCSASRASRACSAKMRPGSVSAVGRTRRSKSAKPSISSSAEMCALTRDWERWSLLVAAPNPPRSATARKLLIHEILTSIASRSVRSATRPRRSTWASSLGNVSSVVIEDLTLDRVSPESTAASWPPGSSHPLLASEQHEDDEDRDAVDDAAPVFRHVLSLQEADKGNEADRAGDRAEVVTAAAEDRDTTDHGGRDRLEEIRVAQAERRLTAVGDEDNPGEGREEATQHVEDHGHRSYVDTGKVRGYGVVSRRVDLAAERRETEDEGDDQNHPEPQNQLDGDAGELSVDGILQGGWGVGAARLACEPLRTTKRQPFHDPVHRQGHDD